VWEKISIKKDTIVQYRTSYVPKTRYEIRFDNKRFNDSLKAVKSMYSDSLEAEIKINKQDNKVVIKANKEKKKSNLFMLGLMTGIILTLITRYAFNQALKKFTRINF
jgi:wyosine [tRNA(Phe)-imidazoG37] synthetase (radical SAM superfamily)